MRKWAAVAGMGAGVLVAALALHSLRNSGNQKNGDAAYHRNPFALNQSGYGTMLARLGQKNLDRAWHFGAVASELGHREGADEHAGHNHGEGEHSGEGSQHQEGESFVGIALDFLVDLDAERFRRTSRIPLSVAHQKAIADDIEKMMLRAYNMAPTDYGAYDAYFHFLMYHDLRRTPEDRKRAYRMSDYTIQAAGREKLDPMPWLTAAVATLNQFFMDEKQYLQEQEDGKAELPEDMLVKYRDRMGYCLGRYQKLRQEAIQAGRWEKVPEDRRVEADERARLGGRMMEQFQAMIDRQGEDKGGGN